MDWKKFHYFCYILFFFFALEPSYIHPDEHFQSLEVLTHRFYNYSTSTPWEFHQETPSRSLAVLYLFYGPLLLFNQWLGFGPLAVLYMARLQLSISYIFIVEWCTRFLTSSKQEGTKAVFFVFSSYVTWCYQTHTFSNSLETMLVLVALSMIQILRLQFKLQNPSKSNVLVSLLAVVCSVGTFNRITFPVFLVGPSVFLIKHFLRFKQSAISFLVVGGLTSLILVYYDTKLFQSSQWVITPWNNLLYNKDRGNLSQHGLHPYYTHFLVNVPQLLGPLIIPLVYKNRFMRSTPFLSLCSGMVLLSIIPHQEPRFLIPIVPLACMCVDFKRSLRPRTVQLLMQIWAVFNLIMGIVMGSFHQRGVAVALNHLRETQYHGVQVWWKTYSPPAYILGNEKLVISDGGEDARENHLIDLMGCDVSQLMNTLNKFEQTVLITPFSSIGALERLNNTSFQINEVWNYKYHLDLDHFDWEDKRSFYPGLVIYNVTKLI